MPEREQIKKQAPVRTEEVEVTDVAPSESGSKIKAELDDLLDEIDEVLETNAARGQCWVRDPDGHVVEFIQPGGRLTGPTPG